MTSTGCDDMTTPETDARELCEFCGLIITADLRMPTRICPKCSSDWISKMDEG